MHFWVKIKLQIRKIAVRKQVAIWAIIKKYRVWQATSNSINQNKRNENSKTPLRFAQNNRLESWHENQLNFPFDFVLKPYKLWSFINKRAAKQGRLTNYGMLCPCFSLQCCKNIQKYRIWFKTNCLATIEILPQTSIQTKSSLIKSQTFSAPFRIFFFHSLRSIRH